MACRGREPHEKQGSERRKRAEYVLPTPGSAECRALSLSLNREKIIRMSREIRYKCAGCGYEADVYEGKGFFNQHITMTTCPDCHTIQPMVVGGIIGDVAPSFNSEVGRLCLNCGSADIRIWDKKTCPKCGGVMSPVGETEFWT